MACLYKIQIQALVFAYEKVAENRTAILRAVMVVPCATAGHQGDLG